MAYTGVFVFGDSLVDSGNVLKLAEFVDSIPFLSIPDGAPTADKGYYMGRFTNGLNFADLVSNKFISVPTVPVFPFGFKDPWFGLSNPFEPDPQGNNLNFAYGGAQIRRGEELVPDLDDQTDAYRDAVDRRADPGALHLLTIGANDVRSLVPANGAVADAATALSRLANAAEELHEEIGQLITIGARHVVVTGIPDIGLIPFYNGLPDESARREAATGYSALLDGLIQTRLDQLRAAFPAVTIDYVSLVQATSSLLASLEQIYDPAQLYPINESELLFFDSVHPTAQVHALFGASILDTISGAPAGETLALSAADYALNATIAAAGEVDSLVFSLAAGATYTFEALGISSGSGSLADPALRVFDLGGGLVGSDDDGGLGLDATFSFSAAQAGDYVVELTGVGSLTGSYRVQADGNAVGNDTYYVSTSGARVLEVAGEGYDTVFSSVDYALDTGVSVEKLATRSESGADPIDLGGNELAQSIIGNTGINILSGDGGDDQLFGRAGDDLLQGGPGNDLLDGGLGADQMFGGDGDDIFQQATGAGVDTIDGGDGLDLLRLTSPGQRLTWANITGVEAVTGTRARIIGTSGNDVLDFSAVTLTGVSKIDAGSGSDVIIGSSDADVIGLGAGADDLTGGAGLDIFDMDSVTESRPGALADTIVDFEPGLDKISLKDIDASTKKSGNQAFTFIGSSAFSGAAGQLRVDHLDATSTTIFGDVNGDRLADFQINLISYVLLQSSDFTL